MLTHIDKVCCNGTGGHMNKSVKVFIIGLVVIVLVGIIGIIAVMEMFKPNDEV